MSLDKLPLISCICPTRNRRSWLPRAIEYFKAQTWPNRELLVLDDGDEGVTDLVPHDDPRIRLMVTGWKLSLGGKRNLLCEQARGPFIAHWDDDDYSSPTRLAHQFVRLINEQKDVTGFQSIKFLEPATQRWFQYPGEPGYVVGTSLFYKRAWWELFPFPAVPSGEDVSFVDVARRQGRLDCAPEAAQMYATIHNTNTSPRSLQDYTPLPGFAWLDAEAA